MGEDITCWACQGLTDVTAGCSSSTRGAAPEALPQGGAVMRTGSPCPINSCQAARSWEKGKWKSRSLFHLCCCCYINKWREQRLSPLNPSLTDSDWKPLPGWLFSDKAWGRRLSSVTVSPRRWMSAWQKRLTATSWQQRNEWWACSRSFGHLTSRAPAVRFWEQHTCTRFATFSPFYCWRIRERNRSWLKSSGRTRWLQAAFYRLMWRTQKLLIMLSVLVWLNFNNWNLLHHCMHQTTH